MAKNSTGQIWGNGLHVAPELQTAGTMRAQLQQSTDDMAFDFTKQPVFALGVLLYEMCMGGEHPVPNYPSIDLATGQHREPAEALPDGVYPAAFVALVHEMVACRPGDRPSMAEVVGRVEQLPLES